MRNWKTHLHGKEKITIMGSTKSMKQILLSFGIFLILTVSLAACGSHKPQNVISNELGIDVTSGNVISDSDTHGGFHGDGTTYLALSFPDHTVLEQIEESTEWIEFPLDGTVKALVYGISYPGSSVGPFLNDGNGNPLIPGIQSGYYRLIDRHIDKKKDILSRSSFNFTLGLYDTDTDTLYYCKLDT